MKPIPETLSVRKNPLSSDHNHAESLGTVTIMSSSCLDNDKKQQKTIQKYYSKDPVPFSR